MRRQYDDLEEDANGTHRPETGGSEMMLGMSKTSTWGLKAMLPFWRRREENKLEGTDIRDGRTINQ